MTPDQKHAYARTFPAHVFGARGPDGDRRKGVRVDVGRADFEAANGRRAALVDTCKCSGRAGRRTRPCATR